MKFVRGDLKVWFVNKKQDIQVIKGFVNKKQDIQVIKGFLYNGRKLMHIGGT